MQEINASDMPRVMQCVGALKLSDKSPRFERQESESKRESDAARFVLSTLLNDPNADIIGQKCPNGFIVTDEMFEHVNDVATIVRYRDFDATIHPSYIVDWTISDKFNVKCLSDCVGWNEKTRTIYVDALKYGWRISEVKENWQLVSYAFGAMMKLSVIPERVVMTIHQPRPHHPDGKTRVSSFGRDMLGNYRQRIIYQINRDDETCVTGPECYRCPSIAICPSAEKSALAAVEASIDSSGYDNVDSALIGIELIMLERAEEALKIRKKALQELAEHRIKAGQHVPHWTLHASLGNRKWNEGIDASMVQMMTGIDVSSVGIVSPAQAEKRGVSKELVASFTNRPSTGFKLVRQDLKEVFKK